MVSSVEGKSNGEIESRNRSEASRREAELNKKHASEVSRMQQEHYEKLKALEEAYQNQMSVQREASKEAMSSRDLKYQQEMDELRKMNREKIMGLTGSYEERLARSKENTQRIMESDRKTNETQKKVLSENLLGEIRRKDKMYQESLEKSQQEQKVGMSHEREKMDEKHKQEVHLISNERNETVERLQDDVRNLGRSKRVEEKEFKNKLFETQKKNENVFGYELAKERSTNSDQQKLTKEAFDNSLEIMQKRYGEAMYEEQMRNEDNADNFKDEVTNRQQGQLSMLERKLRDSKDGAVRNSTETKRLSDLEKQHLMENIKNNLDSMEKTRQAALADSNAKNAQNIREILKKDSDLMHGQITENQEKIGLIQVKHEDELTQTTGPLKIENEKLKSETAIREKQRTEMYERDKKFQEEFYAKNLGEAKKNFEQSLADQRIASIKERNQAIEKLTMQMRQNESKFEGKIATTALKHDKEMQDLKGQHGKDMELMRRNYETRIANDTKLSAQNLEGLKLKYETQIAHQKESYEEKIRQLQKNIDEEKINMAKSKT